MGYIGNTYQLPFNRGGMSHNINMDLIDDKAMVHPSRNIDISHGGRQKRDGTALVYDSATKIGSSDSQIMGLAEFRTYAGDQFILAINDSGDIYSSSTNTIATGLTGEEWFDFEVMDDNVFITNTQNVPQTWDGLIAATCDITSPADDWTTAGDYPQQFVKHGRANSERLWGIGTPSYRYRVYASANGNGKSFASTDVVTVDIETGDGFGILGGAEFGDRLFCFGKNQTYVIDDSDLDSDYWGYYQAPWRGGVATWRLIEKTPNDVIAMAEDGTIYSVRMAEQYGDYKQASLVATSWMHEWIREYVRLAYIDHFHMKYDPVLRALKIFVVRNGRTQVNTALVYFVDRDPSEGWMIYDNQEHDSGYSASVSALIRRGAGDYKIYTGDYDGRLWNLEVNSKNDNDNAYYAGFKTPHLTFGNSRQRKKFKRGWIVAQPKGNRDLNIDWWVDGQIQTRRTVSLQGSGALLGSFILGTDKLGDAGIIKRSFQLGTIGERLQVEMFNDNADEDFYLSHSLIDFQPLAPEAED